MEEKLKQFISQHRAEFDSELPDPGLFRKIESRLNNPIQKKTRWTPLRWAAVISGLVLLSAAFYFLPGKNKNEETAGPVTVQPKQTEERINDDINFIGDASYAKQISQFQELIGFKQEELKQLKKDYPDLYNQFVNDINELDSSYQTLKIKLAENPNREMLLEAMIQNLQLQSELLNRQLLIIKEIKQKTKSHEQTNI